jgi:DNA gyrase subunit A
MARDWPAADVAPLVALVQDEGNILSEAGTMRLTEAQARGILDLRLQRLTGLEREKIDAELRETGLRIQELLEIIASRPRRMEVLSGELQAVRATLASPRLTRIEDSDADIDDESLVTPGTMIVTLTRDGYVKRTSLDSFRAQGRGGRGRMAAATRADDVVVRSFVAHTHQWVLFFTDRGMVFREKVWQLPEGGQTGRGRSLRQVLRLQEGESVTAVLPLPQDEALWEALHLVFATAGGDVRRNRLSDFRNVRSSGLIAMKLEEGDSLIGVATCHEGDDVLLATRAGRAIRFTADSDTLRVFAGRDSTGVRGIRLAAGDAVIALAVLRHVDASVEEREAYLRIARQKRGAPGEEAEAAPPEDAEPPAGEVALTPERLAELEAAEQLLLTVTDRGYGKRSSAYEYRVTGRGGQGIANIALSGRTGAAVVACFVVQPGDHIMLMTDGGTAIRFEADAVRLTGRAAQGVTLQRTDEDERVTSCFPVADDAEDAEDSAETGAPEDENG